MGASVTLYSRRRAHEKRGERGKSNVYRLGSARRGQATPEVISCRLFTSQPSILLCKYYYWPSRAPFRWKIDARTLVLRDEKGEKNEEQWKKSLVFRLVTTLHAIRYIFLQTFARIDFTCSSLQKRAIAPLRCFLRVSIVVATARFRRKRAIRCIRVTIIFHR